VNRTTQVVCFMAIRSNSYTKISFLTNFSIRYHGTPQGFGYQTNLKFNFFFFFFFFFFFLKLTKKKLISINNRSNKFFNQRIIQLYMSKNFQIKYMLIIKYMKSLNLKI